MGRRDDMWSLLYMLVECVHGSLPWRRLRDKTAVREAKLQCDHHALIARLPRAFHGLLEDTEALAYADRPDYEAHAAAFQALVHARAAMGHPAVFPWSTHEASPPPFDPTATLRPGLATPTRGVLRDDAIPAQVAGSHEEIDLERTPMRPLQLPVVTDADRDDVEEPEVCDCGGIDYMFAFTTSFVRAYIHTYIRTYVHTYIHTYIRTCVHT